MSNREEIQNILRGVIWDYNVDTYDVFLISIGEKSPLGMFNKRKAFLRILERLSWYEILKIYDLQLIKKNITNDIINKIQIETIRHRYEILYQLLQGNTLLSAGWNTENRKRLKASLLSDRRYSA